MNLRSKFLSLNLDKKLTIVILVSALVFISVGTGITYGVKLSASRDSIQKKVSSLQATMCGAVQFSLWTYDIKQLEAQMNTFLLDPDIIGIEVVDSGLNHNAPTFFRKKNFLLYHDIASSKFSLEHEGKTIGTLKVYYTFDLANQNMGKFLFDVLVLQTGIILTIIGMLLLLIKILITSRISTIGNYLKLHPVATESLEPLKAPIIENAISADELDMLTDLINNMYRQSLNHQEQLYKLKLEAERASELKTYFLASMSHELRTPLNSILGTIEMLQDQIPESEKREYLEIQAKAGDHLANLINDILDLSKIEANALHLKPENIDFHEVLSSSIKMLETQAAKNKNTLELLIDESVPRTLVIDPSRLTQIVLNLIGNSCKFTKNGYIRLKVSRFHDSIRMVFSDTGIGIPAEQISQLFFPFKQLPNDFGIRNNGSGIGLAICHGLAEVMKGSLTVESQVGQGSDFIFTFPLQTVQQVLPVKTKAPVIVNTMPKNLMNRPFRILMAEDTFENIIIFKAFLKNQVCHIDTELDGLEAVKAFQKNSYDLVFMDLRMPRMNGFDAALNIRKWEKENRKNRTPIIAITAYSSANELNQCLAVGCDSFITKPFKRDDLLDLLRQYGNGVYSQTQPGMAEAGV